MNQIFLTNLHLSRIQIIKKVQDFKYMKQIKKRINSMNKCNLKFSNTLNSLKKKSIYNN